MSARGFYENSDFYVSFWSMIYLALNLKFDAIVSFRNEFLFQCQVNHEPECKMESWFPYIPRSNICQISGSITEWYHPTKFSHLS